MVQSITMKCIFCEIVKGESPSTTLVETDTVQVIIPKDEVSKGHALVMPKMHYQDVFDIPINLLEEIIAVAQNVSKDSLEKFGATGVNLLHASGKDAQQSVFHFHLHVVPRYLDDGLDLWLREKL